MQRTVVLLKPDAVKKGAIGDIMNRFERKNFRLVAAKFLRMPDDTVDQWYVHHREKPFFPELKAYMTSTPIMAMLWEGEDVVAAVRDMCGPTDSTKAAKGTIRGDHGVNIQENAIHASEDVESAERETDLIFASHEIYEYERKA